MDSSVDNVIKQWQSYLTNISSNLMELSEQVEFQLIKARVKVAADGYTGITKARAEQCVESMGKLWQYFALLSEVVDKAAALSSKRSILYDPDNAIRELFGNTLIVIEKEHVSISERNLLSGVNNEKKATPEQLLKYMQDSFESLCESVNEISRADETVRDRVNNMKIEIRRLNSSAKQLCINDFPVFDIDKIKQFERDPLQGMLELDKLVYSIEKYRASIQSTESEYNKIIESFNNIRAMTGELTDLAAKSREAAAKSKAMFGSNKQERPAVDQEIIKSLQDWLQVLESNLAEGRLKAVRVGVSKLEQECLLKLEIERENYNINGKAYNEWLDLKGQFKALLVKAEVLKTKGLIPLDSINDLIENTRNALYADTVKLEICRQLVRKLELSLKR